MPTVEVAPRVTCQWLRAADEVEPSIVGDRVEFGGQPGCLRECGVECVGVQQRWKVQAVQPDDPPVLGLPARRR
ncbi:MULTISPECIES: hypothetical protein [unclassified Frankia]|uniref:hypothetical protein n=1 Tax=unclassified Frankia TaxID=2632575 RepID=UPI002AD55D73|nr:MULTISPECIES: hypothetical protein [unclassified Frankia]